MRAATIVVSLLVALAGNAMLWSFHSQRMSYYERMWLTRTVEGSHLVVSGNSEKALELFKEAQELSQHFAPDDARRAEANMNLGSVLLQKGDFAQSAESFDEALRFYTSHQHNKAPISNQTRLSMLQCLHGLGLCADGMGKPTEAKRWLLKFDQVWKQADSSQLALDAQMLGDYAVDTKAILAKLFLETGDQKTAEIYRADCLRLLTSVTVSSHIRAKIFGRPIGDEPEPKNSEQMARLMLLGQLNLTLHNPSAAAKYFAQAKRQAINSSQYLAASHGQYQALEKAKRFDEAERCLQEALGRATDAENFGIIVDFAHCAEERGNPSTAEQILLKLVAQSKQNPRQLLAAKNELARLYFHTHRPQEARKLFQEILSELRSRLGDDPILLAGTLERLISCARALGMKNEATRYADELMVAESHCVNSPTLPTTLIWCGLAYQTAGDNSRALRCFQRSANLIQASPVNQRYLEVQNAIFHLLWATNRKEEAIKSKATVVAAEQQILDVGDVRRTQDVKKLADCYITTNQDKKAISLLEPEFIELQQAKRLSRPYTESLALLLSQCFERERNPEESQKYADAARLIADSRLAKNTDGNPTSDRLARYPILMQRGELADARKNIDEALAATSSKTDDQQLKIEHMRVLLQLVDYHTETGDRKEMGKALAEIVPEIAYISKYKLTATEENHIFNTCYVLSTEIAAALIHKQDVPGLMANVKALQAILRGSTNLTAVDAFTRLDFCRGALLFDQGNKDEGSIIMERSLKAIKSRDMTWVMYNLHLADLLKDSGHLADSTRVIGQALKLLGPTNNLNAMLCFSLLDARAALYIQSDNSELASRDAQECVRLIQEYLKEEPDQKTLLAAAKLKIFRLHHEDIEVARSTINAICDDLVPLVEAKDKKINRRRLLKTLIMALRHKVHLARRANDSEAATKAQEQLEQTQNELSALAAK
jgi:tetratricopeptide (TPR) repeat protein